VAWYAGYVEKIGLHPCSMERPAEKLKMNMVVAKLEVLAHVPPLLLWLDPG
jgi:hypothetical protein